MGTSVTITGANLSGATGVRFNGTLQSVITANSATSLTVAVPVGATSGPLTVTAAIGTSAPSSQVFTVTIPLPPPTIISFTPGTGAVSTSVTLTGTNLSTTSSVRFGEVPAAFTVVNAATVTLTVPRLASTQPLRLTTDDGAAATALSNASFRVTWASASYTYSLVASPFSGVSVGTYSAPTVTDLDGDGLLDLLVGQNNGGLSHYRQTAPNTTSFTLVSASFSGISAGSYSAPTVTDLDGNGLLDLLVSTTI